MPNATVLFRMTLSDLERLSKIFKDTKRRAVFLRQQSFLSSVTSSLSASEQNYKHTRISDRQTYRQTDRQTDRLTDRQTVVLVTILKTYWEQTVKNVMQGWHICQSSTDYSHQ